MAKSITCGRHDCTFNNSSNCSLNSIAIGKDMTCQFYKFDRAHNDEEFIFWTGITARDRSHAEGLPHDATPEQRGDYEDMMSHITHCSGCSTMFDDREVKYWKACPVCMKPVKEKQNGG